MFHIDERTISKVTNDNGEVSKEDFIKIALENKLLDFGNVMAGGGAETKLATPPHLLTSPGSEKADFETELADYKDSIAALNQATLPATFEPRLAEHFRSERCKTS